MADFSNSAIIDRVREANDIVELISQYVNLKKRGNNFVGLCPFHSEKTASFSVSHSKQFYHCFGCGKGGNVFNFLMEQERMSFGQALRYLAGRANIALPRSRTPQEQSETEILFRVNRIALDYFRHCLHDSNLGKEGREYFKSRGLTGDTIERFQLGFAPYSREQLINFAGERGITPEQLFKVGLVVKKEGAENLSIKSSYYDYFRRRVIFPIFNLTNLPIAFGGRVISPEDQPKYLNSPDSPLFHKGKTLYALNFSRDAIRNSNRVVIVEGYLDLISAYQAGIKNIVAPLGTAFTADQAFLLARFASAAILLFDPDIAGQSAVLRSIEHLFSYGLTVRIARLPQGKDPDTLARESGLSGLQEIIDAAVSYLEFMRSNLPTEFVSLAFSEKEKLIKELLGTAQKISDPARRNLFLTEVADSLGIDFSVLVAYLKTTRRVAEPKTATKSIPLSDIPVEERELLWLFIVHPPIRTEVAEKIKPYEFKHEVSRSFYELLLQLHDRGEKISESALLDKVELEEQRKLILSLGQNLPSDIDYYQQVVSDVCAKFCEGRRKEKIKQLKILSVKIDAAEKAGHRQEADQLRKELNKVQQT